MSIHSSVLRSSLVRALSVVIALSALAPCAFAQEKPLELQPPRVIQIQPKDGNAQPAIRAVQGGMPAVRLAAPVISWKDQLRMKLPLYGHRNWIVIADAAYPSQTSPGIETIYAGGDHMEVLEHVLGELAKTKHIRPVVRLDAELASVPEDDAPGVNEMRNKLMTSLEKYKPQSVPHANLINSLDMAGKQFHILVIKTDLTIPYTSVFLALDCGYWSPEAEKRLREKIK